MVSFDARHALGVVLIAALVASSPMLAGAISANATANNSPNSTDWQQPRADGGNGGAVDDSGPSPYPQLAWKGETVGHPVGIAVDGETAYVATDDGTGEDRLEARNATTGDVQWARDVERRVRTGPFVAGKTVYVGAPGPETPESVEGGLIAFNATSGERRWQQNATTAELVFDGEYFYDASTAVNATTGDVVWNTTRYGEAVAVTGDRLYVENDEQRHHKTWLVAVNATTGATVWNRSLPEEMDVSVATSDGLYATNERNGTVAAYEPDDGSLRWSKSIEPAVLENAGTVTGLSGLAVENGTVYVTADEKESASLLAGSTVHALDATSGDTRWRFETGVGLTTPSVADGSVYVDGSYNEGRSPFESESGQTVALFSLDSTDGSERWNYTETTGYGALSGPAVANGQVFVQRDDNSITGSTTTVAFNSTERAVPEDRQVEHENIHPRGRVSASPQGPYEPNETVTLNASDSFDVDGEIVTYEWDTDGDGEYERTGEQITVTAPSTECTSKRIKLHVVDDDGADNQFGSADLYVDGS